MKHQPHPAPAIRSDKLPARVAAGMLAAALSPALAQAEAVQQLDTVKVEADRLPAA
ncbi:hypothetical protein [Chromobacterium phragmitis]|uniref:hypothetical protein n=1 Tax=Chromobacterium phragmitis TaxID=2202141 RepID=UPI001E39F580|nr:hypothetical protein [Chromobacterium phragmitis]